MHAGPRGQTRHPFVGGGARRVTTGNQPDDDLLPVRRSIRNLEIACRLQRPLGYRGARVRWDQRLGEGFEIGREAFGEVELSGGAIVTQHADAELGGT